MARIQGNIYKVLTLPTEGIETHWEIFLALLHCIIFFPNSSYWLWHQRCCDRHHTGGHPKEADLPFLQPWRRHLGSIWTHPLRLTNLHFISLALFVGTTFSYSDSKKQFPSTSIFRWSPTKIPQPWLNKSRLLRPPSKSLSNKIRKWSYGSNRRRIGLKAIWKMREIVIEGVTVEDLLLQMNRI